MDDVVVEDEHPALDPLRLAAHLVKQCHEQHLQIVSDVHLEFGNAIPPIVLEADAIVAAGDLAAAKQLWPLGNAVNEWLAAHILYVLGNLEFYGSDIDEVGQIFELQYLLLHGTLLWVFVLIVVVITSRA